MPVTREGVDHGGARGRPRASLLLSPAPEGPPMTSTDPGATAAPRPLIRAARAEDLAGVGAIREHAIRTSTGLWTDELPTPAQLEAWLREHLERGAMLVAVGTAADGAEGADAEEIVLGYASYGPLVPKNGYRFTAENSVYLRPEAQGRGLGTALLGALLDLCREHGMHSVVALVEAGNTASIRLHERFGFVEAGRLVEAGWKFDRWWDLVHLQLRL